jgi:hypothetical protein
MKQVKLTDKDYEKIKSYAKDLWLDKGQRNSPNVCKAYVESFISYLAGNNLMLIDGKIYEKEDTKKNN